MGLRGGFISPKSLPVLISAALPHSPPHENVFLYYKSYEKGSKRSPQLLTAAGGLNVLLDTWSVANTMK